MSTITDPHGNKLHGIKAITEQARQRREKVRSHLDKARNIHGNTRQALTEWAERDLMIKRTIPQWSPWAISGAVFVIASANHIATQVTGDPTAVGAYTLGSAVALLGAVVAAIRARTRFINRLIPQNPTQARWMALCAGVAMGWLTIAVMVGITPTTTPVLGVILVGATLALARKHWRHHRTPDPNAEAPELPASSLDALAGPPQDTHTQDEEEPDQHTPIPEKAQYYLDQWNNVIATANRLMPDTELEYEQDITSEGKNGDITTIGYRFRLYLPEDGITFTDVVNSIGKVQNALHIPQKNISPERIPEDICEDPAQMWLKIITHSPIQRTVPMVASRYRCQYDEDGRVERGWVDLGPYSSGDGNAEWTVYSGGDSMWSGLVIGGTGSGKTVVLDTLALSLASNDHTVLWYADGQGGASSNFISQIADYKAFCREEWSDMLSALETIAEARATENRAIGATDPSQRGFHPTPERPGIAVIIDECQAVLRNSKEAKRWAELSKICRKVGICLIMASQSANQNTFGFDTDLREQLIQGNSVVLRTTGSSQAGFVGLDLDPTQLPKIPGYGYLVSGERMAAFRSVFNGNYPKLWRLCGYQTNQLDVIATGAANIATAGRYSERSTPDTETVLAETKEQLDKYRQAANGQLDLVQAYQEHNPDPDQELMDDMDSQIAESVQDNEEVAQMLAELQAQTNAQADIDRAAEAISALGAGQHSALEVIAASCMDHNTPMSATDLARERDISRQRATTLISGLVERGLIAQTHHNGGYELTVPALVCMERERNEMAPA